MKRIVVVLIVLGLSAVCELSLFGNEGQKLDLSKIIEARVDMMEDWENQARIVLALTVAVGILGVITGLLQGSSHTWVKNATISIAAAISIITLINNTVFHGDHRLLRHKARQARQLLDEIEFRMQVLNTGGYNVESKDDKLKLYSDIMKFVFQIDRLEDDLYEQGSSKAISSLQYAYAAVLVNDEDENFGEPKWVHNPPKSERFKYYVGKGRSSSLSKAEENAKQHAVSQFVKDVRNTLRTRNIILFGPDDIITANVTSSDFVDSYFKYKKPAATGDLGVYIYYILLKSNPDIAALPFGRIGPK